MRTASFRLGLIAAGLTGLGLLTGAALPEDEGDGDTWLGEDPVTDVLVELGPEVQTFHRHMSFLASEYLKGRLPGTPEMEIARDYCAEHLELAGLQPAFPVEGSDELSFYQPFELRPTSKLVGQSLAIAGSGERFEAEVDYQALSLGSGGSVTADAAFVGYSINRAPATSGYESYPDETDLTGQIAVMLRFEPMDEDGNSLWTDEGRGPWTARASLRGKVRAAERRGAAGVIVINPPGANDPRIDALNAFGSGGAVGEFPVLHVSTAAGERLVRAAGTTLMDLRRRADAAGVVEPLGIQLEVTSDVAYEPVLAANVGGLLPGKGDLADQYVVVGAHLDHLGMGNFGSRDNEFRGIKVHPGADDNASGSVGVLMLADRLAREYAALGESAHARSIVFVLFDAEESGLNGASHYVDNPVAPLVQHSLMMNFDMIGRIEDDLLSVTGHDTGTGLKGIVMPLYEASPLQVESGSRGPGGSDHLSFMSRKVPALFAIDLTSERSHPDYHTSRDTLDKINRVSAVQAIDLWNAILSAVAVHPQPIEWQDKSDEPEEDEPRASIGTIKVSFGIRPDMDEYDDSKVEIGIGVASVTEGSPAEQAGVQAGDVLLRWNGAKITDITEWMQMLATHEVGDEVAVGVKRNGEELTLTATLAESTRGR